MEYTDYVVTQGTIPEELLREHILPKVFYCIISILGVTGNGFVLFVFYKVQELHVIGHILIGHQSLVDLIGSIVLFLRFVPPSIIITQMSTNHPGLANIICRLWINGFMYWTLLQISTTNLVFITIERYFALVHPIKYRTTASKKIALTACVLAWIVGSAIHMYTPFIYGISQTKGDCTRQVAEIGEVGGYAIAILILVTTLVLPVSIMLYVYLVIIWTLRHEKMLPSVANEKMTKFSSDDVANTSFQTGGNPLETLDHSLDGDYQKEQRKNQAGKYRERGRRNVLITLILVSLTFIICWTPDMIVYFHHNVVTRHDWDDSFHQIVILLAASNVCVNPFIYTLKYKNFQKGVKQVFRKKPPQNASFSTSIPI